MRRTDDRVPHKVVLAETAPAALAGATRAIEGHPVKLKPPSAALPLALSLSFSAVVWGLRCSYTPILPTKRPKRPRIADDGKYIEKFFRHPFCFVRGY